MIKRLDFCAFMDGNDLDAYFDPDTALGTVKLHNTMNKRRMSSRKSIVAKGLSMLRMDKVGYAVDI